MDWLEIAENLPPQRHVRTACPECASGNKKNATVSNDTNKYSIYCFKCGFSDYKYKGQQSLAEIQRVKQLNEQARINIKSIELPKDFTEDIPIEGRMWLYKGSISESTWKQYRIGYSPSMCRVILPIYNESGKLIWFQARAILEGQQPKYIQPDRGRSSIMFRAGNHSKDIQRAIITEDILSAIRVGKYCDTYSLLGTKITTGQAAMLSAYNRITIWLDGDNAGREGTRNVRKTLELVTVVDTLRTYKDPKSYTDREIEELLCH